jgi:hypothetical protein
MSEEYEPEPEDEPVHTEDRIIIKLDPGGPVELTDLTASFAALARMYERHYRPAAEKDTAPKLYVSKLESGSIIAEIVPYAVLFGAVVSTMDSSMVISDFCRRISVGIKAFTNPTIVDGQKVAVPATPLPTRDDAEDLREFMKPLAGRNGAKLGVRHARFEKQDGERRTVAEYTFDETEINRASINIEHALSEGGTIFPEDESLLAPPEEVEESTAIRKNVMLFFEQASRLPGREKGRTGDRGIIPDISTKSLPVYFRKSFQDLKDRMVRGTTLSLLMFLFSATMAGPNPTSSPKFTKLSR